MKLEKVGVLCLFVFVFVFVVVVFFFEFYWVIWQISFKKERNRLKALHLRLNSIPLA